MKRSQQIIIGIGVLFVLGMCIMPPFRFHRTSKYLPIWANTAGSLDTTRLCVQIGAVAILTGGLVFLAKGKWKQGHEGEVIPWSKLAAIAATAGIVVALIITTSILWGKKAEPNRVLTSMDLSKVKLEPLEIWGHGISKYLKCRLYNGTDRAINELQISLYVSRVSDQLSRADSEPIGHMGVDGKRYVTADEFFDSSPGIKLQSLTSVLSFADGSAREYKQGFDTISPVPPASWSEGSIRLSNCPEVEDRAHWLVLLKGAKWEKGNN